MTNSRRTSRGPGAAARRLRNTGLGHTYCPLDLALETERNRVSTAFSQYRVSQTVNISV